MHLRMTFRLQTNDAFSSPCVQYQYPQSIFILVFSRRMIKHVIFHRYFDVEELLLHIDIHTDVCTCR